MTGSTVLNYLLAEKQDTQSFSSTRTFIAMLIQNGTMAASERCQALRSIWND
jgi:hypothetical protein